MQAATYPSSSSRPSAASASMARTATSRTICASSAAAGPAERGALGAAVEFRRANGGAEALALHEQFKYATRQQCGWVETGGSHDNTVQMVYDDCCARLARLFGINM